MPSSVCLCSASSRHPEEHPQRQRDLLRSPDGRFVGPDVAGREHHERPGRTGSGEHRTFENISDPARFGATRDLFCT